MARHSTVVVALVGVLALGLVAPAVGATTFQTRAEKGEPWLCPTEFTFWYKDISAPSTTAQLAYFLIEDTDKSNGDIDSTFAQGFFDMVDARAVRDRNDAFYIGQWGMTDISSGVNAAPYNGNSGAYIKDEIIGGMQSQGFLGDIIQEEDDVIESGDRIQYTADLECGKCYWTYAINYHPDSATNDPSTYDTAETLFSTTKNGKTIYADGGMAYQVDLLGDEVTIEFRKEADADDDIPSDFDVATGGVDNGPVLKVAGYKRGEIASQFSGTTPAVPEQMLKLWVPHDAGWPSGGPAETRPMGKKANKELRDEPWNFVEAGHGYFYWFCVPEVDITICDECKFDNWGGNYKENCPEYCGFTPQGDGSVSGDPHFVGFDGSKFDYHGEAGATVALISSPATQINMLLGPDTVQGLTYAAAVSVMTADGCRVRTSVSPEGKVVVDVNDVPYDHVTDMPAGCSVEIDANGVAKIASDEVAIELTVRSGRFLDISSAQLLKELPAIHGVLGQTALPSRGDVVGYTGADVEYYVSGLWSSDFEHSVFQVAEAAAVPKKSMGMAAGVHGAEGVVPGALTAAMYNFDTTEEQ